MRMNITDGYFYTNFETIKNILVNIVKYHEENKSSERLSPVLTWYSHKYRHET